LCWVWVFTVDLSSYKIPAAGRQVVSLKVLVTLGLALELKEYCLTKVNLTPLLHIPAVLTFVIFRNYGYSSVDKSTALLRQRSEC
jgi:hypothetical protein